MTDQRRLLLLSAGCLTAFVILLVLVAVDSPVTSLDEAIRDRLLLHPGRPLLGAADHVINLFAPLADAIVLTVGAGIIGWRRRQLASIAAVALTAWVMTIVVIVVKHAVGRPPPIPATAVSGDSFPSGHTAAALVCYGAFALLIAIDRPRWSLPLLAGVAGITALVAVALVYANAHWLSDTVGSVLLGVGLLVPLALWLRARA